MVVKVLLVEDNADDIKLVHDAVQGEKIVLTVVSTKEELGSIILQPFDVCLVDMVLPSFSGEEAIELIRKTQPYVPIIVFSATLTQEQIAVIVRSGIVVDVVDKAAWRRLPSAIKRVYNERRSLLALEKAERVNSFGQLVMGAVHDWANCIQPVSLFLEYMRSFLTNERQRQLLGIAVKSLERGNQLQRQLMVSLRGSESRFKPVVLNLLLQNVVDFIKSAISSEIKLEIKLSDLPDIQGDEIGLFQVMVNLILNARDALQGVGTIFITARCAEFDDAIVTGQGDVISGMWVVIVVKDNGPGMSPETASQCWDSFYTTKPIGQGTGLGLSTSRATVWKHGGRIGLETAPGKGAAFTIYLPVGLVK